MNEPLSSGDRIGGARDFPQSGVTQSLATAGASVGSLGNGFPLSFLACTV